MSQRPPKVYLAGPDVFYPDFPARARRLRRLCASLGLAALIPGEESLVGAGPIVASNLAQIAEADAVVANLEPFRGLEPDSGTVFECGYAHGLGKPVLAALSDHRDQLAKLRESPLGPGPGSSLCADGSSVENFNQPLNIMLALTIRRLAYSVEEALEMVADVLAEGRP
jgi:nucleoside 2-deoxyribosyltransferase